MHTRIVTIFIIFIAVIVCHIVIIILNIDSWFSMCTENLHSLSVVMVIEGIQLFLTIFFRVSILLRFYKWEYWINSNLIPNNQEANIGDISSIINCFYLQSSSVYHLILNVVPKLVYFNKKFVFFYYTLKLIQHANNNI